MEWRTQVVEQLTRQRDAFEPFREIMEQYTMCRKQLASDRKTEVSDTFSIKSKSRTTIGGGRVRELEKELEAVKALLKDRDDELRDKDCTFNEIVQRNELLTNENSELKLQLDSTLASYQAKVADCEQILANNVKLKEREAQRVNDLQAFYNQVAQQTNIELPAHLQDLDLTKSSGRQAKSPTGRREDGPPAVQKLLRRIHPFDINCMVIGRPKDKQSFLALGSKDGLIKMIDSQTLKLLSQIQVSTQSTSVLNVALSQDYQLLLQSSTDNVVRLFDLVSERQLHSMKSHSGKVYASGFISHSKAYTASVDRTLKWWDLHTGTTIQSVPAASPMTGGCLTPDLEYVVTSHQNGSLSLWSSLQEGSVQNWKVHSDLVTGVSCSPDGKLLASQSKSSEVVITSMDTLKPLFSLKDSSFKSIQGSCSPQFSPNGNYVAACGQQGLHVWRIEGAQHRLLENGIAPNSICWLGSDVVTTQEGGFLSIWAPRDK